MQQWLRQSLLANKRFWQAIVFSLVILGMTVGIYALILRLWNYGEITALEKTTVQLAIGQVYTGFAAIFLTVTLGAFAVWEFTERRSIPDLELLFASVTIDEDFGTNHLKLHTKKDDLKPYKFALTIINKGRTTAIWYKFELDIPFLREQDIIDWQKTKLFFPVQGRPGQNWATSWGTQNSEGTIEFSSQGQIAIYPNFPTSLGIFQIPKERMPIEAADFICKYRLITDGAPPKNGKVHLSLRNTKE